MATQKTIAPNEPCPGLRSWKTCTYLIFGDDIPDAQIARKCIGHYDSCARYQEHEHAQTSPSCTPIETARARGRLEPDHIGRSWR